MNTPSSPEYIEFLNRSYINLKRAFLDVMYPSALPYLNVSTDRMQKGENAQCRTTGDIKLLM